MAQKDLYKILGVAENATAEEIKKQYRRLAKKYHPDKNPGDKAAEAKFKELSEAADILTDEQKRQQYDQMRQFAGAGFGGGGFDFRDFAQRQGGGTRGFADFGGLGDIFSAIFGNGFGDAPGAGTIPRRGNDITGSISVQFDEAIHGVRKTVAITGPAPCEVCHGSGAEPSAKSATCPECGGTGQLSQSLGGLAIKRTCPRCLGRGRIIGKPCATCGGSGTIKKKRKLAVAIPAGIEDGGQIRLRGQGAPGSGGAPAGDLILTVHVGANQHFDRRGKDIHTSATINLAQALLGTEITVRTLKGRAALRIPAGTKDGTIMRLKNVGAQIDGARGDQYVTIKVDLPSDLTPEEQELVQKLAQSRGWKV